MGTFKKGDWVRATKSRGYYGLLVGDVGRLAEEDDGAPFIDWLRIGTTKALASDAFEPWTPAVGDRVRMVKEVDGYKAECGATVVSNDGSGCYPILLKFDGPQEWAHGGDMNWWVVLGDIEPFVATTQTTTYKVGDRVRVTGNEAWAGVGEVYDVNCGCVFMEMLHGPRAGCKGGFPFREVEPVFDETKFKVGDRVRATDRVKSFWFFEPGDEGVIAGSGDFGSYKYEVKFTKGTGYVSDEHIEAIVDAPLQIEAGRYYKTRDGRKVGPMRKYDSDSWIDADYGCLWREDGLRYFECDRGNLDLVALWQDEPANDNDNATQPDSRLSVTISADTSELDAEIDRVKRRLKKLAKRARKLGIDLEFSDLRDAA